MYLPLTIYLAIHPCAHSSAYLFSYLSTIYLSTTIHPSTYLSTHPSTYPSPSVFLNFALHWSEKTWWRCYCEATTTAKHPATSSIGSVLNRAMLWQSEETHQRLSCSAKLLENELVRKDTVGYFNPPCCPGAATCVPGRERHLGGVGLPPTSPLQERGWG